MVSVLAFAWTDRKLSVLMQVPSNLVLSKIKWPAVWICGAVAGWGAVSAATAAVSSYGGLVACRFSLGVVEAVFFPGAFFYLSMFYNRKQSKSVRHSGVLQHR